MKCVVGEDQVSLYLDSEAEADTWATMLKITTVKRSLQLEGLNLECGAADYPSPGAEGDVCRGDSCHGDTFQEDEVDEDELTREALDTLIGFLHPSYCEEEDTASGDSCETESQEEEDGGSGRCGVTQDAPGGGSVRFRHPRRLSHTNARDDSGRRELLQQMLATKSLLEKKQKNRRSGAGAWVLTAGEVVNEYNRAQHEAQQSALRKAVILRQRKNSTAIKMATLERQQSSKKTREADVSVQLEALRNRLSSLDTQLKESEQDTERMLQDLEQRRNQELHLIKDLGGVDDGLGGELGGVSRGCGSEEGTLVKGSHGGSLMGSLPSIPSIVVSPSERKAPEKIFGIKVGNREGRLKARNPLHFLDLKLRVSRRHKSTECLTTTTTLPHTPNRSHSSTPANGSCSDNSSDDELDHHHRQHHNHHHHHHHRPPAIRTEIRKEALQEIETFKQLIERYFTLHPRHDSITAHAHEIIL
ncbi:uncharacterized protein LOC121875970 isoform X2 [Homarus americanus]|uniref:uncharacterized protein LOC121875970 isoform X2 n=1 Tax=Homarus americanus TaxID=6706 RepID=UPI001C48A6C6|nr:uncharacterized protein LOC121875970 isoform X2 [Homarus americanus]